MDLKEPSEDKDSGVRKSVRFKRPPQSFSPDRDGVPGDRLDVVKGKKRRLKSKLATAPDRPCDILPNGQPFQCNLCKSPYVINRSLKRALKNKRSKHNPAPRSKKDPRTGKVLILCNACSITFDITRKPRKMVSMPTAEEKDKYLKDAKEFAKKLAETLNTSEAERLYCPVVRNKACGCLQKYIMAEGDPEESDRRAKEILQLLLKAKQLSSEKYYSPSRVASPATETKSKKKSSKSQGVGMGNGRKRSKAFEEFVLSMRTYLKKDLKLCERGAQRVLTYSNNFLHKKLVTEKSVCRAKPVKGLARLGRLLPFDVMAEQRCCVDYCVMMAITHRKLLTDWRNRASKSQSENRRVIAEMLTPSGARTNCYTFINLVTGSSRSTIVQVSHQMKQTGGEREPPAHGMKKFWQGNSLQKSSETISPNKAHTRVGKVNVNTSTTTSEQLGVSTSTSEQLGVSTTASLQLAVSTTTNVQLTVSTHVASAQNLMSSPLFTTSSDIVIPVSVDTTSSGPNSLTVQRQQLMQIQQQMFEQQVQQQQQQHLLQQQLLKHTIIQQIGQETSGVSQNLPMLQQMIDQLNVQIQNTQQQLQQSLRTMNMIGTMFSQSQPTGSNDIVSSNVMATNYGTGSEELQTNFALNFSEAVANSIGANNIGMGTSRPQTQPPMQEKSAWQGGIESISHVQQNLVTCEGTELVPGALSQSNFVGPVYLANGQFNLPVGVTGTSPQIVPNILPQDIQSMQVFKPDASSGVSVPNRTNTDHVLQQCNDKSLQRSGQLFIQTHQHASQISDHQNTHIILTSPLDKRQVQLCENNVQSYMVQNWSNVNQNGPQDNGKNSHNNVVIEHLDTTTNLDGSQPVIVINPREESGIHQRPLTTSSCPGQIAEQGKSHHQNSSGLNHGQDMFCKTNDTLSLASVPGSSGTDCQVMEGEGVLISLGVTFPKTAVVSSSFNVSLNAHNSPATTIIPSVETNVRQISNASTVGTFCPKVTKTNTSGMHRTFQKEKRSDVSESSSQSSLTAVTSQKICISQTKTGFQVSNRSAFYTPQKQRIAGCSVVSSIVNQAAPCNKTIVTNARIGGSVSSCHSNVFTLSIVTPASTASISGGKNSSVSTGNGKAYQITKVTQSRFMTPTARIVPSTESPTNSSHIIGMPLLKKIPTCPPSKGTTSVQTNTKQQGNTTLSACDVYTTSTSSISGNTDHTTNVTSVYSQTGTYNASTKASVPSTSVRDNHSSLGTEANVCTTTTDTSSSVLDVHVKSKVLPTGVQNLPVPVSLVSSSSPGSLVSLQVFPTGLQTGFPQFNNSDPNALNCNQYVSNLNLPTSNQNSTTVSLPQISNNFETTEGQTRGIFYVPLTNVSQGSILTAVDGHPQSLSAMAHQVTSTSSFSVIPTLVQTPCFPTINCTLVINQDQVQTTTDRMGQSQGIVGHIQPILITAPVSNRNSQNVSDSRTIVNDKNRMSEVMSPKNTRTHFT